MADIGARERVVAQERTEITALLALVVVLLPGPAESRFLPSPCCAILSTGLGTISRAISTVVGGALDKIGTTLNSIEAFEKTVVWPKALIDRARGAVGDIEAIFVTSEHWDAFPLRARPYRNQGRLNRRSYPGIPGRLVP